ncbi:hypothetical protein V2J09_019915 [Rumex salicifolius]
MSLLTANHWARVCGGNSFGLRDKARVASTEFIQIHRIQLRGIIKVFATRKSAKKLNKSGGVQKDVVLQTSNVIPGDDNTNDSLPPKIQSFEEDDSLANNKERVSSASIPSRSSVLQACIVTSGLIAALGLGLRQVSHAASSAGLPILDCGAAVSFDFEFWHLELIAGLIVLISSSRYLLLKAWPDFAESSERANKQVLTSLDTYDYALVAFLPGISEELLFRGALLPLFGLDWKSALLTAAVFGILHLGNGRNYSFAAWATFVGLAYGYSTIFSSSMVVPMASHALNNLVGAILWRYKTKKSSEKVMLNDLLFNTCCAADI